MARVPIPFGGGADLDAITVDNSNQVLTGKTILDNNGEPMPGTLPNKGNSQSSSSMENTSSEFRARIPWGAYYMSGSVLPYIKMAWAELRSAIGYTNAAKVLNDTTIARLQGTMTKQGNYNVTDMAQDEDNSRINIYINQGGYVTGESSHSNRHKLYILFSNLRGVLGISQDKLWPGATIAGITSNKQTMAGQTITPKATSQTVACNGKAMTGNIIVNGDSRLIAANIKRGVTIFGITGTWEGYVALPNYLYRPGVDSGNWAADPDNPEDLTKESGMMVLNASAYGTNWIYTKNSYNFTGYTRFNIDLMPNGSNLPSNVRIYRYKNDGAIGDEIDRIESPGFSSGARKTLTFDITNYNATIQVQIWFYRSTSPNYKMNIYNVWLS